MKLRYHRPLPKTAQVKTLTICRDGTAYYACFSVEEPLEIPRAVEPKQDTAIVGIDLGCHDLYYGSDETHVKAPRIFRQAQQHVQTLQRRFLKTKKRTPKWYKLLRALGKAHARVRRQRTDFLHKAANTLLHRADIVVHEDLHIQSMTRRPKPKQDECGRFVPNRARAKAGLNTSILDAGWGQFLRILQYKAQQQGKRVIAVPPHYTSQACSACGQLVQKSLSQRTHMCDCGFVAQRDHNAACNITALGLKSLEALSS